MPTAVVAVARHWSPPAGSAAPPVKRRPFVALTLARSLPRATRAIVFAGFRELAASPAASAAGSSLSSIARSSEMDRGEMNSAVIEDSYDPPEGSIDAEKINHGKFSGMFSSNGLLTKLRQYGVAGVLAYGLLNTVYYLTTFLLVWFYVAPVPGNMGYMAAVERFFKMMAMVWAGSQVTKLVRAAGALALAPLVARVLSWFTAKFNFQSEGKAFAAIAALCFALAVILFIGLTVLWA